MLRNPQVLTIFTSKSLPRAGVVQFLGSLTSKSAPNMPVFNDFDFQIALAHTRGAIFVDILGSRSLPVWRQSCGNDHGRAEINEEGDVVAVLEEDRTLRQPFLRNSDELRDPTNAEGR